MTENGFGGISSWGSIYHLKNDWDWSTLKNIFSGHDFVSFRWIESELKNPQLQIRYNIFGKNPTGAAPTFISDYSVNDSGILQQNGSTYITKGRVLQKMTLLDSNSIRLSKIGYHLPIGQEWITNNNSAFASGGQYMPKEMDPIVGTKDHGITMYANWKPNKYTITYHANGGTGTMTATNTFYDTTFDLKSCAFSRTGYRFAGWALSPDGMVVYTDKQQGLKNLTTVNEDEIKLYAVWLPDVCEITIHIGSDSDMEKGILTAEAILRFRHPIGTEGTVSTGIRTIILEEYEE